MSKRWMVPTAVSLGVVVAVGTALLLHTPREPAPIQGYSVSDDGMTLRLLVGYGDRDTVSDVRVVSEDAARVDVDAWTTVTVPPGVPTTAIEHLDYYDVTLAQPLGDRDVYAYGQNLGEDPMSSEP